MITPPQGAGRAALSTALDGDLRADPAARSRFCASLEISDAWAELRQIHGNEVERVDSPGIAGEADALWTTEPGLPIAIFTADCLGVVLLGSAAAGVAHAGWRGTAAGVIESLADAMTQASQPPQQALIGPGIGPCCFEVGPEVAEQFPTSGATTSWGTRSVDLVAEVELRLGPVPVVSVGGCTRHEPGYFSYRATGTTERMATVAWV